VPACLARLETQTSATATGRMVETSAIGLRATLFSTLLDFPLSFLAAHNLMARVRGGQLIYTLMRALFNIVRAVDTVVWGLIVIVWVGLGAPKQEKWMARMRPRLSAPVLVGVGAAFDFHAGLVPQAPDWLQEHGLEWAYRLARAGVSVELPERTVTVYRFDERWRDGDRRGFEIECSSGTYVRSLIASLGDAYCEELRRTAIGDFEVGFNTTLSDTDESFISTIYPREQPAVNELEVDGPSVEDSIGEHGEEDTFQFQVSSGGKHVVETDGQTDLVMALFGPDDPAALLGQDDDSGKASNAKIEAALEPGKYVTRIRHFRPTGIGSYSVSVRKA